MCSYLMAAVLIVSSILPVLAQNTAHRQPTPEKTVDMTSDAKRAETNALIEKAQKRQNVVDARNSRLWERWTYAVCIGCGDTQTNVREVYTTPGRVLAGVRAAADDARQLSLRRKSHVNVRFARRARRRATPDLFASPASPLNDSAAGLVAAVNGPAVGS